MAFGPRGQVDVSKQIAHVNPSKGIVTSRSAERHPHGLLGRDQEDARAGPRGKWVMLDSSGGGAEYSLLW
jgi:hypothetical protein